jgi:hypothetical protein
METRKGRRGNAGGRCELRQAVAPRLGQGDAVIDPAVDAVTVGQPRALEIAVLLVSGRERTTIHLGQLVIARDLDAAGLDVGHRVRSELFDERAIVAVALGRSLKLRDIACGHPGVPVQVSASYGARPTTRAQAVT